ALALAFAAAELTRAGDPAAAPGAPAPSCAPSHCATTPPGLLALAGRPISPTGPAVAC
ncbi:hypothetical protein JNW91_31495, partial [Micromonospora sp. STR1_7]|nr:hypothetical protein [Micromonospora parastrephiae]